jgi:hypothetical protein
MNSMSQKKLASRQAILCRRIYQLEPSDRLASDIWYRKARRVEKHEVEQIKQALGSKNVLRRKLHELETEVAILRARLAETSEEDDRVGTDWVRGSKMSWEGSNRTRARDSDE